jgi:hypothetical protein
VLNQSQFNNSVAAGGGPLSLFNLDTALAACREPTHILAPRAMYARFIQAARNTAVSGFVVHADKDQMGLSVMYYNGKQILWGYEPDDTTPLTDYNEVGVGGGGAVTASLYVLSLKDEGISMIEGTPMAVRDLGLLQARPFYSTHIKWDCGLTVEHPRAGVRLTSISNAAFTA